MSSSRLPGKVALSLCGKPLLHRVVQQARRSRLLQDVIVATSDQPDDDVVEDLCERIGVACSRGSLNDAQSRFVTIAEPYPERIYVRLTGDNPLTEPSFIDQIVRHLRESPRVDYAAPRFDRIPHGSNSEAFRGRALLESRQRYDDADNKEHVTPALRQHFRAAALEPDDAFVCPKLSVTVDTLEDFRRVHGLIKRFGEDDTLRKAIEDWAALESSR